MSANVWNAMSVFDCFKICMVLHRSRIVFLSFQKMRMLAVTMDDARLCRLRAIRIFLMTSLRFFRYFLRITNASKDTTTQSMGNATSKPTLDSSPEVVSNPMSLELVVFANWF